MAGTVVQGTVKRIDENVRTLTFTCTGDASDGTVPNTDITEANMNRLRGFGLDTVEVNPGTPAPDAADVTVKNTFGIDLLDGTGTNLIHATDSKATVPQTDGQVKLQPIFEPLTIATANQATVSAVWVIRLVFVRL